MERESSTQALAAGLHDVRVLVVEDEYFIADDIRRALAGSGAQVAGPFATVSQALAGIEAGGFDCAVIDLNLHGDSAEPVAERLSELGIPFLFATGYGSPAVPGRFNDVPRCEKPFDPIVLVRLVAELIPSKADSDMR